MLYILIIIVVIDRGKRAVFRERIVPYPKLPQIEKDVKRKKLNTFIFFFIIFIDHDPV